MTDILRITERIHQFVQGHLAWDASLQLLDEIVESEYWMNHLEIDMILFRMAVRGTKIPTKFT